MLRPKTTTKNFTGHTDNEKCNIWGLETAATPRRVKVQHIRGIANVFADSLPRLKSVGLYHVIDSNDHQQEFSTLLELLPPVEPVTDTLIEMNEAFITPDIDRLLQTYDTLLDTPTSQAGDDITLSLENASPTEIPQLEENLMSLPELTHEKVIKLQKSYVFCKNILQHIGCSKYDIYFKDALGILHKR